MKIKIYMPKLIVANWKNKIHKVEDVVSLARLCDREGFVLCPPHELLDDMPVLQHAVLGAQDYAPDLAVKGVRYVIVGHSDRRTSGETDMVIAEKLALAIQDGLVPILCVGETSEEREKGKTDSVIKQQIHAGLARVVKGKAHDGVQLAVSGIPQVCFAYEPVWAISSNAGAHTAAVYDATRAIAAIKEQLLHSMHTISARFLYGGSVTTKNAGIFLDNNEIDGVLVGAASIDTKEILSLWQQTQK